MSRPRQYDARTTTTIRLDPAIAERLRAAAEERDVSANWLMMRAVEDFLDRLIPPDQIQWTRDPDRG